MKLENLKLRFEKICEEYIFLFCKKHDLEFSFWVSDEIGGMACFVDYYFFSLCDIMFDVNNSIAKDYILHWYDDNDSNIPYQTICKNKFIENQ